MLMAAICSLAHLPTTDPVRPSQHFRFASAQTSCERLRNFRACHTSQGHLARARGRGTGLSPFVVGMQKRIFMNTSRNFKASLIVAALLSFSVAQAATLTKAEYKAEKTRISAEYKLDEKACDAFNDNAEDICEEEAKAKEKVALAEREYRYTGKAAELARRV